MPRTNRPRIATTFASQSSWEGRHRGRNGRFRSGACSTFTNRVMFGPEGCPAKGSVAVSLRMSPAGQIMMSHLNGSLRAHAARRTDSLTSLRTTNVPTAPMLITPKTASSLAMAAGRHRFALPTFTARRKTTEATAKKVRSRKAKGERGKYFADDRIIFRESGQIKYEEKNSDSVSSGRGSNDAAGAAGKRAQILNRRRRPAILSWRGLLARGVLLGLGSGTFQRTSRNLGSRTLCAARRLQSRVCADAFPPSSRLDRKRLAVIAASGKASGVGAGNGGGAGELAVRALLGSVGV